MMLRVFLFLAMLPNRVLALGWDTRWDKFIDPVAGSTATGSGNDFLIDLAHRWYDFLYMTIAGFSIIAFIWGASTMQGVATDEANKENGKKIMIGAMIGLVLAILAGPIIDFVYNFADSTNFPVCGAGGGPGCR